MRRIDFSAFLIKEEKMKYHNITKDDMVNGDGLRVVLWTAGCEHHCKGCQNPCTWNPDDGLDFDDEAKREIFAELDKPYISGITFSSGDPLATYNRTEVLAFAKEIKEKYPNKTIWAYTGYTYEALSKGNVDLSNIDVLVDGPFIEELKDVTYHWAGSTNQNVLRRQADGNFIADEKSFGNYDKNAITNCPSCHD